MPTENILGIPPKLVQEWNKRFFFSFFFVSPKTPVETFHQPEDSFRNFQEDYFKNPARIPSKNVS